MKLFSSIIFIVVSCVFVSCGHDENVGPKRFEFLTSGSGNWKLTALTGNYATSNIDLFSTLEDCVKDNVFYFGKDLSYQVSEGVTKCDPADPDIYEMGTWQINNKGTQLIIRVNGGDTETTVIQKLDMTTLEGKINLDLNGQSVELTATYTKQ